MNGTPSHTLLTDFAINLGDRTIRRRNVVARVTSRPRGGSVITISDGDVVLTLSEAERISLIEALGGTR